MTVWAFQPGAAASRQLLLGRPSLVADAGMFALTGQTVSIPLKVGTGLFTLNMQALGNLPLIASSASFQLTFQAFSLAPLTAAVGMFALSGQTVLLSKYRLTMEHAIFHFDGRLFNQPITAGPTIKLVTLGDSITEYATGPGSAARLDAQADGEIHWVKARGKAGFQHEQYYDANARWIHNGTTAWASAPLSNGANQGRAGDWISGVRRRLTAVINMAPHIVVLSVGTNLGIGEDNNTDAATAISQLGIVVSTLTAAGIKVVVGTIRPRVVTATGASGTFSIEITPAFRGRIETINAAIRTMDNDSTVFVWDSEADLLDPNPSTPLLAGSPYRWAVRDGVHLAPRGAFESSRTLELTLDRILKDGTWFNADATLTSGGATATNSITNGGFSTGSNLGTVGAGVGGLAATNHSIIKSGTAAVGCTSLGSLGTTIGWPIVVSGDGGEVVANNYNTFRIESANISVAGNAWTSSVWLKLYAEIEVDASNFVANITTSLIEGSTTVRAKGMGETLANRATEATADGTRKGWIETHPVLIGAATTFKARLDVDVRTDIAGRATVTLKRWIVRAVQDPRITFPYDPMNPQIYALSSSPITFLREGLALVVLDRGLFALAGQAVTLLEAHKLQMGNGTFVAAGNGSIPLIDETGAYLLDETGAVLLAEELGGQMIFRVVRLETQNFGAFALNGQDLALQYVHVGGYNFAAEPMLIALTGQDILLATHVSAAFDHGIFTRTGQNLEFYKTLAPADMEAGLYGFTGHNVQFRRDSVNEAGLFVLSGGPVDGLNLILSRRAVYVDFGPNLLPPGQIEVGDTYQIKGVFRDEAGELFDPHSVVLHVWGPYSRSQRSYTYGDGVEIVRTSSGLYTATFQITDAGRWRYAWDVLSSDIRSVKEGVFIVQRSRFSDFRDRYTG